jgi:glucose/arabinose dehydrogenase
MTSGVILRILACIALTATGALVNGWRMSAKVARCETTQAQSVATRAEAARTEEIKTAIKESKHAQDTIYNADRLANLKTGIDVDVRAELARAERLHRDTDSRAATYRAQAQADAVARSDLADKAAALDRQLAEGLGVVASLGGDLRRRDAEVAALCDQVNIERRLSGDDSDQACSQRRK